MNYSQWKCKDKTATFMAAVFILLIVKLLKSTTHRQDAQRIQDNEVPQEQLFYQFLR